MFEEIFARIRDAVANENELNKESLRFLSLLALAICAGMSFIQYTYPRTFLWVIPRSDGSVTFKPAFISTIIGVALIAPLYIRGILKWTKSIYGIISFILILMVFASFIELAVSGKDKSDITYTFVGIAVILSWLGLRAVAGAAWMLVFAIAIYSIITTNMAMEFYDFIYITSGVLGLVFHSGLNPGELFNTFKEEYVSNNDNYKYIKGSIGDFGNGARKLMK